MTLDVSQAQLNSLGDNQAVLSIPPLIPAGIHGIRQNPGIPAESNGIQESGRIQEFRQNPTESRNSGRIERILAGIFSIPCLMIQKTNKINYEVLR
jgi:hypothetical protein